MTLLKTSLMMKKALGVLLIGFLYAGASLLSGWELRFAIVPFITLLLFVVTFAATFLMLQTRYGPIIFLLCGLAALAVMLVGQNMVLNGYVTGGVAGLTELQREWLTRNGGFHNANQAGIIALMVLFGLHVVSTSIRSTKLLLLGVAMVFSIILIAQSRSGFLFFCLLSLYILKTIYVNSKIPIIVPYVLIVIALVATDQGYKKLFVSDNLRVEQFRERITGTSSEDSRLGVAAGAWELFVNDPINGNGLDAVARRYGISAHNMILESLAAFGLFGSAYLLIGSILLYRGQSAVDYFFCLVPAVMFTHNLFDQTAMQVALGFAFGAGFAVKISKQRRIS